MNGKSERLIGKVLNKHPEFDSFVITKGGYIQNNDLTHFKYLNENNKATKDVVNISNDFKYSIHPEFIDDQIKHSLKRLNRVQLDGYLLHNPEHYFDQEDTHVSPEEYYCRIKKIFEFLEEKVQEGIIRYYGVSSNTFTISPSQKNFTDILELINIAERISNNNHFSLIQFPFNLIEKDALIKRHNNKNLIEVAKANKLTIFCNRPLNAITKNGPLRIATYDKEVNMLTRDMDEEIFPKVLKLIRCKLDDHGIDDDLTTFPILNYLNENWTKIRNHDTAVQIMETHFFPFLNRIYEDKIPEYDAKTYTMFYHQIILYSRKIMTEDAIKLKNDLLKQGMMKESTNTFQP